jgi:hypothetical protein
MAHGDPSEIPGVARAKRLASGAFYCGSPKEWYAMHLATFNQVWTHPDFKKKALNKALVQEFCHNASLRTKSAQLHQVINWLDDDASCPTADEYRDFAESIALVLQPFGLSKPISKRNLPRKVEPNHRDLAKQIIDIVTKLANSADDAILPDTAKRQMLLAVTTFLSRIVPLVPKQCPKVLDFVEGLSFPKQWTDSREVFEFLMATTGKYVTSNGAESLGFTITRPRDPHMMISEMFQIFECLRLCKPFDLKERSRCLRAVFPVLLGLITFNNAGVIPIYWLRRCKPKHVIYFVLQLWHETDELLRATEETFPSVCKQKEATPPTCGARLAYIEVYKLVKDFVARQGLSCPHILFEKMLNVMPRLLTKYLDFNIGAHGDCFFCNHSLYDYKTLVKGQRFLAMSAHLRKEYVDAAMNYRRWLLNDCPRDETVRFTLAFDSPLIPARLKPQKLYETQRLMPWVETIDPTRPY